MMRWISRLGAAGAALALMSLSPAAQAAEGLNIDHVESEDGKVSVVVSAESLPEGTTVDGSSFEVTVDGKPVEVEAETLPTGQIERITILALDASNSMRGAPFEAAKAAAKAFLGSAPEDVKIGLVTFAGEVTTVAEPTTDRDSLTTAIDGIALSHGTALYDGIVESVGLAGDDGARSVLVLSDGKDIGSDTTLDATVASAADSSVVVDVVSLEQDPAATNLLGQIADSSGGQVIDASSPDALARVFEAQASALAHQILVTFDQPIRAEGDTNIQVTLAANHTTYTDAALVSLSPVDSGPTAVDQGSGVGTPVLLAGGLALGLGLALVIALMLLGERGPSRAEQQISAYFGSADPGAGAGAMSGPVVGQQQPSLRDSAVAFSEKMVSGDFESRLNAHLVGGGLAVTPAEWLLIHAGIAIAGAFVGLVVGGGVFMVVGLMGGIVLPWLYLRRKHSKRLAAFNAQLAETLDLIAGGLGAGLSMPQAVDTVVREGVEPMAGELRRVLIEQRLGVDITDALDGVATRMDSGDFGWVVMAIRIQREVGGNLAELLRTVADTLREREYLRRQVRVLSAEGRFSAWVLGALPIVMFLYMMAFRKDFVVVLYTTGTGLILLGIAIVMLLAGFWVMSRMVKIEV